MIELWLCCSDSSGSTQVLAIRYTAPIKMQHTTLSIINILLHYCSPQTKFHSNKIFVYFCKHCKSIPVDTTVLYRSKWWKFLAYATNTGMVVHISVFSWQLVFSSVGIGEHYLPVLCAAQLSHWDEDRTITPDSIYSYQHTAKQNPSQHWNNRPS